MGGYLHPLHIGWRNLVELNLSADPEGAFAVLNTPCPVTLMNAHVCLQAPFDWRDLERIEHWGPNMRRIVRNWLLAFGDYCGVSVFYLWDLVPAIFISHPELFDDNPVWMNSTVTDLETGTLVVASEGEGSRVNMPERILDPEQFRAILWEAWRQTPLD